MRTSDQTSPNAALIALRDRYRVRAIRTWNRFQAKFATNPKIKMLGFQSRRDFYIGAAEAVGEITGFGDGTSLSDADCSKPSSALAVVPEFKIDSGLQPAAVSTEEK